MLRDSCGYAKIYIAVGNTDLRYGIDGLARKVKGQFNLDPYDLKKVFVKTENFQKVKTVQNLWPARDFMAHTQRPRGVRIT